MAEEGASLVLVDLKAEALETARGEIAGGTNITNVAADVSDQEQVKGYVHKALDEGA